MVAVDIELLDEPVASGLSISLGGAIKVGKVEGDNFSSVDAAILVCVNEVELLGAEGYSGFFVSGECDEFCLECVHNILCQIKL